MLWSTMTTSQWVVNVAVISPTLSRPPHPQILQQKPILVKSDFLPPANFFLSGGSKVRLDMALIIQTLAIVLKQVDHTYNRQSVFMFSYKKVLLWGVYDGITLRGNIQRNILSYVKIWDVTYMYRSKRLIWDSRGWTDVNEKNKTIHTYWHFNLMIHTNTIIIFSKYFFLWVVFIWYSREYEKRNKL